MQIASSWEQFQSIFCIRPDNMGDLLMTTPAIRALKEAVPGRRITLLTSTAGAAIAGFIPEIDEVITFDVPWVSTQVTQGSEQVMALVQVLKKRKFDAAIIFTVQSQNPLPAAMLCYMAGIPRVLGYCRENPYRLLSDWVPDTEVLYATRHEVERQLELLKTIGCTTKNYHLSLKVSLQARQQILQHLVQRGVNLDLPWLVLHAGVSEEKRRYPASDYIQAAQKLMQEEDYQFILTGNVSEWEYVETIRRELGLKAFNLAGKLSLEAFAGLIAQTPVLISNNTGPVHIASALGTPVVVLYAMTNPQHTPWRVESRVLYFEVPPHLCSRNVLLQQFPGSALPKASPDGIVNAVKELITQKHSIQPIF